MSTVKARFSSGVPGPSGVIELEAGQEVILPIVDRLPLCRHGRGTRKTSSMREAQQGMPSVSLRAANDWQVSGR